MKGNEASKECNWQEYNGSLVKVGRMFSRMRSFWNSSWEVPHQSLPRCLMRQNTCDNDKVTHQVRFDIHIHATSLQGSLDCYY